MSQKTNPGARTGVSKSRSNDISASEHCKQVAATALLHAQSIVEHLLPDGERKGHEWVSKNPTRTDKSPGSFSINLSTGAWGDFSSGDKGGDLVSLCAYVRGMSKQSDAADYVAEFLGLKKRGVIGVTEVINSRQASGSATSASYTQQNNYPRGNPAPVMTDNSVITDTHMPTVPADAPPAPDRHKDLGTATAIYRYDDANGALSFRVHRFDGANGEKEFRPQTLWKKPSGEYTWKWKAMPAPRLIYRLPDVIMYPHATVILTEGEKACDAASALFLQPHFVVTTFPNGAKAIKHVDWALLKGRRVWLWADHDDAGKKAMAEVEQLLTAAGATEVRHVDAAVFAKSGELPAKYDAADALRDGWTAPKVDRLNQENRLLVPAPESPESTETPSFSVCSRTGVRYTPAEGDPQWICTPLIIAAAVRDEGSQNWGRLLKVKDREGSWHQYCMPMESLKGSGEEVLGRLLNLGLEVAPSKKRLLLQYVQSARPPLARCVSRTGFVKSGDQLVFVTPTETLGLSRERVVFQSERAPRVKLQQSGSLNDWQENVSKQCIGNSRLVLSVCVSLAAPTLFLLQEESGLIHIRGNSSSGKSTALAVGASVFGAPSYVRSWRATANGIEALAAEHNDLPLFLDELAQLNPKEAGDVAYLIANGLAKSRANKSGEVREVLSWRTLGMSAGEIALADHMQRERQASTAGMEIRVCDIPADAGAGLGLFETTHGAPDGDRFARTLKNACQSFYGAPGRKWLEKLADSSSGAQGLLRQWWEDVLTNELQLPEDSSGQVRRVASRFALIAAAGEVATHWGITGWQSGTAAQAIATCFAAWLKVRGTSGDLERQRMIAQCRKFFESYGDSKFPVLKDLLSTDGSYVELADPTRPSPTRAGYRHRDPDDPAVPLFLVFPETFKDEICRGFSSTDCARVFAEAGLLKPSPRGEYSANVNIPGARQRKMYRFTMAVFEG